MMDKMDNNKILEYAQKTGCDIDGDVIYIEGRAYYVHIMKKIVKEIKKCRSGESGADGVYYSGYEKSNE